jgi:prepilin peptidase CpaA
VEAIIPFAVVITASLVATVTDLRHLKVYNALTFPLLLSGPVYHLATGGAAALQSSLLGAAFGFGILLLPFVLGGIGGGDVKLMSGVGAWLGLPITVCVFVVAGLIAGVYALLVLVFRGGIRQVLANCQMAILQLRSIGRHLGADERIEAVVTRGDRWGRVIPFGVMIALGVIVVLVSSLLLAPG